MGLLKRIKSRLTMKRGGCRFVDRVSGSEVFEYVDCYGVKWLAEDNHLISMRVEIDT